jgi:single-stranded-DNA-specific exonuclease
VTSLLLPLGGAAPAPKPYLGVVRSLRGKRWQERLAPQDAHLAAALSQRHSLPEMLGRILAARGASVETVPDLLNPTIRALLPEPHALQDMEAGAERLACAIARGEPTAVFGDYDVDGASSSALLARMFRAHGLNARVYIPDRITEGYGPNDAAIEGLVRDGAKLVVTADCGATSHGPLGLAKKLGASVVVVDHHQSDEVLPPADALINPNRLDDMSGQGHLCAAGVMFLLLVATVRKLRAMEFYTSSRPEPNLLSWLDLVGLATVCDVVPLHGVNRAFVVQGLKVMHKRRNAGLRALADAAGLNSAPTPYHLGFVLGPRINAGGRIGDAALGSRLLACDDDLEAREIAQTLDRLNRERQEIEAATVKEALAEAEAALEADPSLPILIAGSPAWHKGLVGLVASRLTERFGRPSLILAWDEAAGEGSGSARSVAGADIGKAVRAAVARGVLKKGGGHAMAAGVTVDRARLEELTDFLGRELRTGVGGASASAVLEIDGALIPSAATRQFADFIERAGPYGMGNPAPRFVFPAHRITAVKAVGEGGHLRCLLRAGDGSSIPAVAFRAVGAPIGDAMQAGGGAVLHAAGRIKRNTWGGRDRVEFEIEDLADPRAQGR